MTIPVVWLTLDRKVVMARGFWDQAIVEDLLAGQLWRPPGFPEMTHVDVVPDAGEGAVVVLPGSYHRDRVPEINALLAPLPWVLLIVTGDEGSDFPWRELDHGNLRLWVQNPRRDLHDHSVRGLPVGYTPPTRGVFAAVEPPARDCDWFFGGQVSNSRRRAWVERLRTLGGGRLVESEGFAQGIDQIDYLEALHRAKVAPCPGGIVTPDTFRVWEALEAGCVPIVDTLAGERDSPEYWAFLLDDDVRFPRVGDLAALPEEMDAALRGWPANANHVGSWYQGWKRTLAYRLAADLRALGAPERELSTAEHVTVLIPTSPIAAHPSTDIIEQTIASVLRQPELAGCEIIVMADGVRPEQEHYRQRYTEYLHRLHQLVRTVSNVWVHTHDEHLHQAEMTWRALGEVSTTAVLFVEHDTPLVGEIPWASLVEAVRGPADLVRLHHEASVLPDHEHLMLDREPSDVCGAPMLRTVQWSQRPHLANTGWYRRVLAGEFPPGYVGMIEPVMHSVVECAWRDFALAGWDRYRLWMYAPDGDMRRSGHLDGRGDDPKWEMG